MVYQILKVSLVFCLVFTSASLSFAQGNPRYPQASGEERASAISGPRRQLATIIFAGLGGAILGLSTLSFYGRPQEKLSNIAIGFAVGVISGTAYVTYKAATNPEEFYAEPLRDWRLPENGEGILSQRDPFIVPQAGLGMTFTF